jgi:nitronate monooxygenase
MWPNNALTDRLGIELPIIQAPMAGAATPALAAAVSNAGALGSLGFGTSSIAAIGEQIGAFANRSNRALNWNFFCHPEPTEIEARSAAMRKRLAPIFAERGLPPPAVPSAPFASFGIDHMALIESHRPRIVSFHYGLPTSDLLAAVKTTGAIVMCSATSVAEARLLAEGGADVIIAQGAEAGGHRGTFTGLALTRQAGTMALVPQIVDAVDRPVVAAGGITDGRGIAAALMLGASAVQMGTAFLFCPESQVSAAHRKALAQARDDATRLTRLLSGKPARSLINELMERLEDAEDQAAPFPTQTSLIAPLRQEDGQWSSLWAGQAAALGREMPAADLVKNLAEEVERLLRRKGTVGPPTGNPA